MKHFLFISLLIFFFSVSPLHAGSSLQPSGTGRDHFDKALNLMQEGTLDESEEQFKEAIQLEPMNSEYRFELANLYAMRHDELWNMKDGAGALEKLKASKRELEQAVMTKPDFLPAHFNLGVVYKKLAQYENARAQFKEVLKLDLSQTPAMLQIGATYEEQGFYDEAQTIYQDLIERYPGRSEFQNALR